MMTAKGYETVTSIEDIDIRQGKPGNALYKIPWMLLFWLLLLISYTLAVMAFAIFVIWRCPSAGRLYKVLPTGSLEVDQFYSGLTLSVLLTPAALLIRRLANDVALIHPFALASRTHLEVSDLDILMDPGVFAMGRLFKYSVPRASIQALIMAAGAFLVPVGTLLVFPGMYAAPTHGTAAVGMPMSALSRIMGLDIEANEGNMDFFLWTAANIYVGKILQQVGDIKQLPPQLGPVATANLTYQEGVTYNEIVTYTWSSGCQYTDEITFTESTEQYEWMFNVTMPDGTQCNNVDAYESQLCIASKTDPSTNRTTAYYALMGTQEETVNFDSATAGPDPAVTAANGSWISRTACTPNLTWQISSCTWRNGSMTDCSPAPIQNTSNLDTEGLNKLPYYISKIPFYLHGLDQYTFGFETTVLPIIYDPYATSNHQYRAPALQDYDNMYGLIAQSIVTTVSAGYYGVTEVTTTGSTPKPVYLVRMHILAIVVGILFLCPLSITVVLFWGLFVHRMPLRPATFLTIANAVRGPWWDAKLWGTCLMSPAELRSSVRGLKVAFGAVPEHEQKWRLNKHVGLAERTEQVSDAEVYYGVGKSKVE